MVGVNRDHPVRQALDVAAAGVLPSQEDLAALHVYGPEVVDAVIERRPRSSRYVGTARTVRAPANLASALRSACGAAVRSAICTISFVLASRPRIAWTAG